MSTTLRFHNQVAVVTGAGNGLGKQYALLLAQRGAKVVVNDMGGDIHGASKSSSSQVDRERTRVADVVVEEIKRNGGVAVANYDPVQQGERIIQTAIDSFGRVDILINNAGILRDITLRKMSDVDWDTIMDVHLHGTMRTARAAWPYMKKQKYGRIVNTTSASGMFGNFGQSNYAAAKMAVIGLSETLAKEGSKHNIFCNVIAPAAASRLTATVLPPDVMQALRPEWVAPLIGALCHSSCSENGSIFEAGAGHFSKLRWERSHGWHCRPEDLTPDVVIDNFAKITDWAKVEYPDGPADPMQMLSTAKSAPRQTTGGNRSKPVDFTGRVALITGAGSGLGRAYALELSRLGASVAVLDLNGAQEVVDEIKAKGGKALAIQKSVTDDAEAIIEDCIRHFGGLHILISNAGILRDKSFQNMSDDLWHSVMDVHLRATFKLTKAAWPHFLKNKYGRVISTTSVSGIYGNFGQSNYSAAKCGIIGFNKSIAREGAKYNIVVNTIAPTAGTKLTATTLGAKEHEALSPAYVAPLITALCSETPPVTGTLFEGGAGWFAATHWQRTKGMDFDYTKGIPSIEDVAKAMPRICDFDNGQADNPDKPEDGSTLYMANIKPVESSKSPKSKL